jgi:hypothetical protein
MIFNRTVSTLPVTGAIQHRKRFKKLRKFIIGRDVKCDHIETDLMHIAEHICGVPRKIADAILQHSSWEVVHEEVAEKSWINHVQLGRTWHLGSDF